MALGRETGMETTTIRPPLVYGPGVRGNFRGLMNWAASGMPSIFAAVKNKRSFVQVENLCDLLITVLDHSGAACQVFLVSDGRDLSTHELFLSVKSISHSKAASIVIPIFALKMLGKITRRDKLFVRRTEKLKVDICGTQHILLWKPPSAGISNGAGLRLI